METKLAAGAGHWPLTST